MVSLSPNALSASNARRYHRKEFANARSNYYTEGDRVCGEWRGQLAARLGLAGEVSAEQFARLTEGQHPLTGEQLVQHRASYEYLNAKGEPVQSVEHRAGWDAVFSAPKSVSVTALVGGDERVREAHRESVLVAAAEMEKYAQARMPHVHAETTGAWVAVSFDHDSSRPVESYAAPQIHTHLFIANITQCEDGKTRSLQTRDLYRSQRYTTTVYRAELAVRLQALGYEIERGEYGQPEIKGYTKEYLRAASPRRQQIEEEQREKGVSGPRAAQLAALMTRESKKPLPREEVLVQHQQMAQQYGNLPQYVVAEAAYRKGVQIEPKRAQRAAQEAMEQARQSVTERKAVEDERMFLFHALRHSMGQARLPEVRAEFERHIAEGKLIEVPRTPGSAGREFTTPEMQRLERELIGRMRAGRDNHPVLVAGESRHWAAERHPDLSQSQQQAVEHVLTSRDLITALDGVAGAGKTTSLKPIREAAVREGYEVLGLAPTARAAQKLADAEINYETLQMHLQRGERANDGQKRLYVLDESSLASTQQMHRFVSRLKYGDRVLLLGDARQHEAVDAGRPYAQLQAEGMRTAKLEEILRQRGNPALLSVVEQLARGEVKEAVAQLNAQGRVHEVEDYDARILAIARAYAQKPEGTLVVSPDNQSRREINARIHRAMQEVGQVSAQEHTVDVLQQRQDLNTADRLFAHNYAHGNVLRYQKSSTAHGFEAGEYVRVVGTNEATNIVTVERKSGECVSYDPRRQSGVTVYRERECVFSEGDRVQLTAAYYAQRLANRELGTIQQIDADGNLKLHIDSTGREIAFNIRQHPHLDLGFAVTSYSSQGQTCDRVLIHADSELAPGPMLNQRFAYVAISRAQHDAQIFTNDASALGYELSRDVSKSSALQQEQIGPKIEPKSETTHEHRRDTDMGIGL
jgi:conjugative relaxase-like TrwC/TraI family protein